MGRLLVAVIIAAAISTAGPTTAGAQQKARGAPQDSVETAIRAVHEQMQQAAERLDATSLFSHVLDADIAPIIENGSIADTRAAALYRTALGLSQLTSLTYSYTRQSITELSPGVVLWVGEGTSTAKLRDGRQVSVPFAETVVFVQRDGQWKVLHAHRSSPNPR